MSYSQQSFLLRLFAIHSEVLLYVVPRVGDLIQATGVPDVVNLMSIVAEVKTNQENFIPAVSKVIVDAIDE